MEVNGERDQAQNLRQADGQGNKQTKVGCSLWTQPPQEQASSGS